MAEDYLTSCSVCGKAVTHETMKYDGGYTLCIECHKSHSSDDQDLKLNKQLTALRLELIKLKNLRSQLSYSRASKNSSKKKSKRKTKKRTTNTKRRTVKKTKRSTKTQRVATKKRKTSRVSKPKKRTTTKTRRKTTRRKLRTSNKRVSRRKIVRKSR